MAQRPALVVAHPGHELVLFGWLEENRPVVSILTDGSGRSGVSRVGSSLKVLRETGAEPGPVMAPFVDQQFYAAILQGNSELFVDVAVRLGDALAESRPPYVAGDAREGFNPTHDICRMIIDAAVARARRGGAEMGNYEFSLFVPHDRQESNGQTLGGPLGEEQFRRKIAAAHAYPELAAEVEWASAGNGRKVLERYPELAAIFDAAIEGMSESSYATEHLLPARPAPDRDERPFYELYSEALVADGVYQQAIRYRDHVAPIERALAAL